jgi:hypothetical protein
MHAVIGVVICLERDPGDTGEELSTCKRRQSLKLVSKIEI